MSDYGISVERLNRYMGSTGQRAFLGKRQGYIHEKEFLRKLDFLAELSGPTGLEIQGKHYQLTEAFIDSWIKTEYGDNISPSVSSVSDLKNIFLDATMEQEDELSELFDKFEQYKKEQIQGRRIKGFTEWLFTGMESANPVGAHLKELLEDGVLQETVDHLSEEIQNLPSPESSRAGMGTPRPSFRNTFHTLISRFHRFSQRFKHIGELVYDDFKPSDLTDHELETAEIMAESDPRPLSAQYITPWDIARLATCPGSKSADVITTQSFNHNNYYGNNKSGVEVLISLNQFDLAERQRKLGPVKDIVNAISGITQTDWGDTERLKAKVSAKGKHLVANDMMIQWLHGRQKGLTLNTSFMVQMGFQARHKSKNSVHYDTPFYPSSIKEESMTSIGSLDKAAQNWDDAQEKDFYYHTISNWVGHFLGEKSYELFNTVKSPSFDLSSVNFTYQDFKKRLEKIQYAMGVWIEFNNFMNETNLTKARANETGKEREERYHEIEEATKDWEKRFKQLDEMLAEAEIRITSAEIGQLVDDIREELKGEIPSP